MIKDDLYYFLFNLKNRIKYDKVRKKDGKYSLKGYDELKTIFVHIPKCGGVSINQTLFGNLGGGHKTVEDYKKIFGPITFYKYFSFAFVRNPYTRLYSAYTFLKGGGFDERDLKWRNDNLHGVDSFEEFVLKWLDQDKIWEKNHFYPQHYYVCDKSDNIQVDYVGKVENLREDFNYVCKKLDVNVDLKHHNKTQRKKSIRAVLNKKIKDKIYSLYGKDFEIFDYSCKN